MFILRNIHFEFAQQVLSIKVIPRKVFQGHTQELAVNGPEINYWPSKALKIKACVRYFLSNFRFSPNDSPSKTMKNVFHFI